MPTSSVPLPTDTPSLLYLAGLIEGHLSVLFRKDRYKVVASYRSPSVAALRAVQQLIGGTVNQTKASPFLCLGTEEVLRVAEALRPLGTPRAPLYDALIALRCHKAAYSDRQKLEDPTYLPAYTAEVLRLGESVTLAAKAPVDLSTYPEDNPYRRGHQEASVRVEDPSIAASLVWARDHKEVVLEARSRKAAKVKQRIEDRDRARRAAEEAHRARVAKEQAEREAGWAETRKRREDERQRQIEQRRAGEEAAHQQMLADIARGERRCGHCKDLKPLDQFSRNRRDRYGYARYCKPCVHAHYVVPRRAELNERCKAWQAANPETLRECQRRQNAKPIHRLRNAIRGRIKEGLDRPLPSDRHVTYLGCTVRDLKAYLETLWQPGMSWETYGLGVNQWCIDHIVPHTVFNHQDERHLGWCWSYRNLRPLWNRENTAKSDQIGGLSARHYRCTGRDAELHDLVGTELERLGITTKAEYLASIALAETSNGT